MSMSYFNMKHKVFWGTIGTKGRVSAGLLATTLAAAKCMYSLCVYGDLFDVFRHIF